MVKPHKKYKNSICAYCGSPDDLEEDHIPPKNLFPKPRPSNLISVPACKLCHGNTSKDDEYFRLKILMRQGVQSNPSAHVTWTAVLHSLSRNQATGLRKRALLDFVDIELKTKSGLYVGKRLGYNVDMNRIRNVIQRIVRGLYFVESGNPLGLKSEVLVYVEEDLQERPSEAMKQILQYIKALSPKIIGNNVFLYRYQIMKEKPFISVWGMSFYEHVPFLAITRPKMKSP